MDKPHQPQTPGEPGAPQRSKDAGLAPGQAIHPIGKSPDPSAHLSAIRAWAPKLQPAAQRLADINSLPPAERERVAQTCADLLAEALEIATSCQKHIVARMEHEASLARFILHSGDQLRAMSTFQLKLLALHKSDRSRVLELIGMLRADGLSKLDPNTVAPRLLEHLSQMKADEEALVAMSQESQARDQINRIMRGAGIRPKSLGSEDGAPAAPSGG